MSKRLPLPGFIRRFRSRPSRTRGRVGIRTRLLAIVLITSVALLAIGVGAAAYLVNSGRKAQEWADLASSTTTPAILMVQGLQEERRLSLLDLAGDPGAAAALLDARKRSDIALAEVSAKGEAAQRLDPDGSAGQIEGYRKLFEAVPNLRAAIDARAIPREDAFGFFSSVIDTIIGASVLAARVAPDAGVGTALSYGVEPLRAAEALSKADTSGAVALTLGELSDVQLLEFNRQVGEFRGEVAYSATVLKGPRLAQLQALTSSPAWHQLIAVQDAVMLHGPIPAGDSESADSTNEDVGSRTGSGYDATDESTDSDLPALPLTIADWQRASGEVVAGLLKLWEGQSADAHAIGRAQGTDTANRSLAGGAAVLLITGLAFLAALLLANRFIGRMRHLRDDTLELADQRLPDIMQRLDRGEKVDSAAEVARLDFGTDELGEVADAFNRAQVAAVSAAVAEARTRAGFHTVFLNIAHRNQLAVHRQLALLDKAERQEENADQLELLFQLDHLATRARRHAENLIVLGGEQSGRRWRNPVPLWELIRGAVAESLDYTRIHTGRVPDVLIAGKAVADLIHLLAELMDNATAFSPPESQVEVSATVVGKGVAVEVADQGLGMTEEEVAARNSLLAEPPDFGVAALTGDTRLGLFVVATLAARHNVTVRLTDSVYGGIKAIAVIPTALIESGGPERSARPALEPTAAPASVSPGASAGHNAEPAPRISAGAHPTSVISTPRPDEGHRPALPRRQRRSAEADTGVIPIVELPPSRTPEQARNLMSAIEGGTRSGRRSGNGSPTTDRTREEGTDDDSSAH
ncbi:sensor histidine kinase [Nocardia sp. NBC_01329]|uniref:sensor histidine kinase n=1 Tax=Nocardia sp. NBC_01329 TaxID=2903594 RepID=UPI002E166EDA|nr:nitrate- and nitrite sensing domain-containing protein [Nocardia sp. NBC_01329]